MSRLVFDRQGIQLIISLNGCPSLVRGVLFTLSIDPDNPALVWLCLDVFSMVRVTDRQRRRQPGCRPKLERCLDGAGRPSRQH